MADRGKEKKPPFPVPAGEGLEEIWIKSAEKSEAEGVSVSEVEEALYETHTRLGWNNFEEKRDGITEKFWLRVRYLVAAIALIIFAGYFFFTPRTVTVPHGEIAMVKLPDGSSVQLNSGSTVAYSRLFGRASRDVILNGEGYFTIQAGQRPFRVKANGSITKVTGTTFNIRSWSSDPGSETVVAVTGGEVEFFPAADEEKKVVLHPGKLSRWNPDIEAPSQPDAFTAEDITGWLDQRLVFQEKPLIVIFNELERRYNVEIDLDIPGADLETLTAYYATPRDIIGILEDITMVKGFRYAETANGYRVFK